MFGFGSMSHLLVIAALALIFIGPKQLPEVARALGKLLAELRRSTNILTDELKLQTFEDRKRMMAEHRATVFEQKSETEPEVEVVSPGSAEHESHEQQPKSEKPS
jgi:Sec-independent protein translocase protein TatA